MIKTATFYLIDQPSSEDQLSIKESLACALAAQYWRNGQRVLIACENKIQAERLDEALWQRDPEAFVPHNLTGEGPKYGAPVELCWPEKRGNAPRDVLINLLPYFADFATIFHQVVDFVPFEEIEKQLARERYKTYRSVGFQLTTSTPPTY